MSPRNHYVVPNWGWLELQAKDPKVGPQRAWSHQRKGKARSTKGKIIDKLLERYL